MPMVYSLMSYQASTGSFVTSGSANIEVDQTSIKPGTRNIALNACYAGGKGAGLTAISGISYRFKKWTTAASTGSGFTATPRDPGFQGHKATCAMASGGLNAGTGGPTYVGGFTSGAAGPGGWVAPNPDSMMVLEGSAASSLDLWSTSGTVSLNFDVIEEFIE